MNSKKTNESTGQNEAAAAKVGISVPSVKLIHRGDTNTKAVMSVSIGKEYALHGVKVVAGPRGDFVSLPSFKGSDGQYHDYFHPITVEARAELYGAVMAAYKAEQEQKQVGGQEAEQEVGAEETEAEPEEGPSMAL